ncbi:MAG: GRP family sugar transporter [Candidatus Micrarchaeia archaeon]
MFDAFILVFLNAFFWGSWPAALKKARVEVRLKTAFLTFGVFFLSVFVFLFVSNSHFSLGDVLLAFASGVLWSFGAESFSKSVERIGMARSGAYVSPLIVVFSVAFGVLFFGEFFASGVSNFLQAVFGALLVSIGLFAVSLSERHAGDVQGFFHVFLAAFFWTLYAVPLKLASAGNILVLLLPMSVGMIAGAWLPLLRFPKVAVSKRDFLALFTGGAVWGAGNVINVFLISSIGFAKALSASQLAMLFAVAWGVFVFKEAASRKQLLLLAGGSIVALAGVLLLLSSRT